MAHHNHGHSHSHGPAPSDRSWRFSVALLLNALVVSIEGFYGFTSHSVALLSDAVHNLADVLALFLAWGAVRLAARTPTKTHTYGYRGSTILASLTNGIILLVVTGGILWESLTRFSHPEAIQSNVVMIVAALGILLNGLTALLFIRGSESDLNTKAMLVHMAGDAAVSASVVITALLIRFTDVLWLDALAGAVISIAIIFQSTKILKQAFNLSMAAVPDNVEFDEVERYLSKREGVCEVHDLHIWAMSTTEIALTAHLVMSDECDAGFLTELSKSLHDEFGIEHATIQVERLAEAPDCRQADPMAV